MLLNLVGFSFFFSIFINYFYVVQMQMENKNLRRHSDQIALKLLLRVPFYSVPKNPYQLLVGQQLKKGQRQKKGRQKERKSQKERRPSTKMAPIFLPPLLINAFTAPSSPPSSSASAVVFDQGGGGQWEWPVVEEHRHDEQMAKLATGGTTTTERGEEHSVVHLISRPTQLYYFGNGDGMHSGPMGSVSDGRAGEQFASASVQVGVGQVCRVKVPTADVFYISYEDDERSGGGMGRRPFVDVFFHCSQYWAWCCGIDCCQIDPALVFTGACVLVMLFALFVHWCLRSELGQRVCIHRLLRIHRRRHKRIITRANAQRRRSAVDGTTAISRGDGAIVRKPSVTVSIGNAEQIRHDEQQKEQQKRQQRSGSDLRRMIRNSIRQTIGRGHRRLVRTTEQLRGDRMKNGRSVPQIVVTEPSSSSYGSEDEQEEDREEEEEMELDEE